MLELSGWEKAKPNHNSEMQEAAQRLSFLFGSVLFLSALMGCSILHSVRFLMEQFFEKMITAPTIRKIILMIKIILETKNINLRSDENNLRIFLS